MPALPSLKILLDSSAGSERRQMAAPVYDAATGPAELLMNFSGRYLSQIRLI